VSSSILSLAKETVSSTIRLEVDMSLWVQSEGQDMARMQKQRKFDTPSHFKLRGG
jgi:hypothetical protein